MTGKGFTQAIKDAARARDGHCCAKCGKPCPKGVGECHHRRTRGMGGSRRADTNDLCNICLLCEECHDWVGRFPLAAEALGWRVKQHQNPATEPVRRNDGTWWLLSEKWTETTAPRTDAPVEVTP